MEDHQSICTFDATTEEDQSTARDAANTITTTTARNKGTGLLQTKNCVAFNGSKSVPVRILFDNGSQGSYVTSNLSARLYLKPVKTESLHLNTFGDNNYRMQRCDVVKLSLETRVNGKFQLTALNFPVICFPDIVSDETIKGDTGPTAVASKFGWLLSRPLDEQTANDTVMSNLIIYGENNQMMFNSRNQDNHLNKTLKQFKGHRINRNQRAML